MREKPVTIEVRKNGQHWAVLAEEQLITLTVYEKGAHNLEAVLRGLLRYTSRKLFRQALRDSTAGPKPPESGKKPRAEKSSTAEKSKKAPNKKAAVRKESAAVESISPVPPPQPEASTDTSISSEQPS